MMTTTKLCTLFSFLFCLFATATTAQDEPIRLTNPSFEDFPRDSRAPNGWYDCGKRTETPPDVQPGHFRVLEPANDGFTYLGMVVRDNDTWESVSQRMSGNIQGGQCYDFSIYLCRSDEYYSRTRSSGDQLAFFTKPAKLRIWAGNGYCDKRELLAESALVTNTKWKEFKFKFKPRGDYSYIILEAFYKTPVLFPYNGNLLLDNSSSIKPTDCNVPPKSNEPDDPIASKPTDKPKPTPKPDPVKPDPVKPDPIVEVPVKPESTATLMGKKKDELKVGETLRVDRLNFKADSFRIEPSSYAALNEIYDFLKDNSDVVIEVGGHTNGRVRSEYGRKLSTSRAKAVRDYLTKKGIPARRITYKGYGKTQLIADDRTLAGRRKNQRVEVKILKIRK